MSKCLKKILFKYVWNVTGIVSKYKWNVLLVSSKHLFIYFQFNRWKSIQIMIQTNGIIQTYLWVFARSKRTDQGFRHVQLSLDSVLARRAVIKRCLSPHLLNTLYIVLILNLSHFWTVVCLILINKQTNLPTLLLRDSVSECIKGD